MAFPTAHPARLRACAYPDLGIHDTRHLMVYEPNALRNQLDFSPQTCEPFTEYPNIVFAPHTYTHSFTIDQQIFHWPINNTEYPPSFDFAYDNAVEEAAAMNSALFVTEYGCGPDQDWYLLNGIVNAQDKHATGSTMWSWKSNCMSQENCGGAWSLYQAPMGQFPNVPQNGPINANREKILSRVYPRYVAGAQLEYGYDAAKSTFSLGAVATDKSSGCADDSCVTTIFVPYLFSNPAVTVKGHATATVETLPDKTNIVSVRVNAPGAYSVGIALSAAEAEALAEGALGAAHARTLASTLNGDVERRDDARRPPARQLHEMLPASVLEGVLSHFAEAERIIQEEVSRRKAAVEGGDEA
eukprot:Opistho-2@64091